VIVFYDTNVVLDVCAQRVPFYADSAKAWDLAARGAVRGLVAAISMTTIDYLIRRHNPKSDARALLRMIRGVAGVAPCDSGVIDLAIDSELEDFEDAVQYFSAIGAGADVIVTRDGGDFPLGNAQVMTPREFLASFQA
jgi:predicted nucleic acid-binding protein